MLPSNSELINIDYLAKKYDESNAPLYISYPTSSHWKNATDEKRYLCDLSSIKNPFLYFHFPFCENSCHYCMCYKVTGMTKDHIKRYAQDMVREIELKSALWGRASSDSVSHIHWGGGTPTCLDVEDIKTIFDTIARHFNVSSDGNGSISIEAFPNEKILTQRKLSCLRRLGFNEISFGIQDLDERVQQAINRLCRFEEIKTLVGQSKEEGFKVHIDLCYGLPFQELGGFENTMKLILSLKPDRVAMLTYVHYPLLYENQRCIPMSSIPNSFMRVLLSRLAQDVFTNAGYQKIGFDHFVRADNSLYKAYSRGNVSRDLMGYSVGERKNIIGFGSSAISFLHGTFYHNSMTINDYREKLGKNTLPVNLQNAYTLSRDDVIRNDIIQKGVLSYFCIDKNDIQNRFGILFDEYFSDEIARLGFLEKDGLVNLKDPSRIEVTRTGRHFCRHVASVFDRYYRTSIKKG